MTRGGRLGVVLVGIIAVLVVAVGARADLPVPFILRADADLESSRLTIWARASGRRRRW